METEKIISELKTRSEINGDGMDRTIADYVNLNLPADGIEPDDDYFAKHVGVLKSISGNFNHAVATQVNEFKKNYKPTTTQQTQQTELEKSTNDFEARLKAIEDANEAKYKALEEKLAAKEKASEQKSYISQLEGKFKAGLDEKGLIYDPIYFEHIVRENGDFDTTKSVDEAVKTVSEKYDKMFKDRSRQINSNGFISDFQNPSDNGGNGEHKLSQAEIFKARMRDEGYLPNVDKK